MDLLKVFGIVLLAVVGFCSALPYSLISPAQDVDAEIGETVTLKCVFEGSMPPPMVFWSNNSALMSSGKNLFVDNDRIEIQGGAFEFNLVMKDVGLMDEGEFDCQAPGNPNINVKHTINVVIPPMVTALPEEDDISAMEGEDVSLSCASDGKPDPTVTWTYKRRSNSEEVKVHEGEEFTLGSITPDNAGTYICTASNGFGDPAREEFDVDVMFTPTVFIEEPMIHTGPGDEVELDCIFTSNPEVHVIWSFNGKDLELDDYQKTATFDKTGEHELTSTLTLKDLSGDDLGHYTCRGANGKGEASGVIELSGLPFGVEFFSDAQGLYSDVYTLKWEFSSEAPPSQCLLKITMMADGSEFGSNTVPAEVSTKHTHKQHFRIEGLATNTAYGASVNCQNEFGETGWSDVFAFSTSQDENPAPPPTTTLEPAIETTTTLEPSTDHVDKEVVAIVDRDDNATVTAATEAGKGVEDEKTTQVVSDGEEEAVDDNGGKASAVSSWTISVLIAIASLAVFQQLQQ